MNTYKVEVYVETPYYTEVEANSEEEAIQTALGRDVFVPYAGSRTEEDEWITEGPEEFPNLGKNEEPSVELIEYDTHGDEEEDEMAMESIKSFKDFING